MKKLVYCGALLFFFSASLFSQDSGKKINLKDYTGDFLFGENNSKKITFTADTEKLTAKLPGNTTVELIPVAGDEFKTKPETGTFRFERDSKGVVVKVKVANKTGEEYTAIMPAVNLNDYVGSYEAEGNEIQLQIALEGGKLIGRAGEDPDVELTLVKRDEFVITQFEASIIFPRDEKGNVSGIRIIKNDGMEIAGKKLADNKKQ